MTENPSSEQQQVRVIGPRTAPDADEVRENDSSGGVGVEAPFAPALVDGEVGAGAGTDTREALTRCETFEDLAQDAQDEFITVTRVETRRDLEQYFESRGVPHHDAEDLTSETYDILIKALMAGKPVRSQRAFAFGIARKLRLSYWARKKDKVLQILTDEMELYESEMSEAELEGFAEALDIVPLFEQCTRTLSPYQVAVFYARSILDLPYDYLSKFFGKTKGALRTCHSEALDKIHADAISLADLRLASRYSTYSAQDITRKPKRPTKKKRADSEAGKDRG
ncbi:hypothetical protein OG730_43855 (plasmid) [Streptomyces sp. NBC_01298]|uniref:sigma-70 family RNA polymerase sigma factor n=1 Tax=Streptomyces sp. NBC_01298 TaxID=2903817 RepID=UPI002E0F0118|nr:hypothetical protein OG730_43855 [Streptomyces sp. NBC_01298]